MHLTHHAFYASISHTTCIILCKCIGHEFLNGIDRSILGFVLDNRSIGLDDIYGGERLGVQVGRNEFTFFVSTEFVDINVGSFGEFRKFVFHFLAKLAPWSVDSNDRRLSRLCNLQSRVGGLDVLYGTSFPQVAVPSFLGTIDVNSCAPNMENGKK